MKAATAVVVVVIAIVAAAAPLLALASAAGVYAFAQPQQGDNFGFYNQSSFVDESRILHLYGEAKNESDAPVKGVVVEVSFYDGDGRLLGTYQRAAELRVINPGESSPFEILYLDSKTVGSISRFELAATGEPAPEAREKKLQVVSANSRLDVLGTYYINLAARNAGTEPAANSIAIATLYDGEGRVVAIGRALAEAGPGSSDIKAGAEAAFGIVVTEKLQTYKAASYSLVIDSDQYASERIVLDARGPGFSQPPGSNNNGGSSSNGNGSSGGGGGGCLIATAAFGSELAPQVQQLRAFRDGIALKTVAGSSFMQVFNAWYYSFSPQVASYEREQPWLQQAVRVLVYPLLAILDASAAVYHGMFPAVSGEAAIVAAGVAAGALVGAVYLSPVAAGFVMMAKRGRGLSMRKAGFLLAMAWSAGLAATASAGLLALPQAVMMFGTSLLVLSAASTAVLLVTLLLLRVIAIRRKSALSCA